jgi:phosphotransferase system  glucose/maltose/N-acetylglucosamine-specific IIC component
MVWSGFLAACLGSLLGFAWLDPGALLAVGGAPDWLTPDAVYTLGFFLFFTVGLAGACLGVYLTRPPE